MGPFESRKATKLWGASNTCERASSIAGWGAGGAGAAYALSLIMAEKPLFFALVVAAILAISALGLGWLMERLRDNASTAYRTDYQDWWDAKMRAEERDAEIRNAQALVGQK